jgi:hypothetical protein
VPRRLADAELNALIDPLVHHCSRLRRVRGCCRTRRPRHRPHPVPAATPLIPRGARWSGARQASRQVALISRRKVSSSGRNAAHWPCRPRHPQRAPKDPFQPLRRQHLETYLARGALLTRRQMPKTRSKARPDWCAANLHSRLSPPPLSILTCCVTRAVLEQAFEVTQR